MEQVKIPKLKRVFDVAMSLLLLILCAPFFLLVLLGTLIENIFIPVSRGRFFYNEARISAGEPFRLYKFRIFKKAALMKMLQERSYIYSKDLEKDKNNLTYIGRFLKLMYLDELPQLFNVLKGEMSLVGPRPTNLNNSQKLFEAGKYSKYLIKGGITGPYQLQKGVKLKQTQEEIDMAYVDYCQNNPGWKIVLHDIKILFRTIPTILKAKGV